MKVPPLNEQIFNQILSGLRKNLFDSEISKMAIKTCYLVIDSAYICLAVY